MPRFKWLGLSLGIALLLLGLWIWSTPPPVQSALPLPLQTATTIPRGQANVMVDGLCNTAEYNDALAVPFTYPNLPSGTLYLKHDGMNLYICLRGRVGTYPDRFAGVYLDYNNGREPIAEATDLALRTHILSGTLNSYKGSGVLNGYVPIELTGWNAAATSINEEDIEYRIALGITGGRCGNPFGLAVYHHWLRDNGDDAGWPGNQYFDRPNTWSEMILANAPCQNGRLAYIYDRDTATAGDFKTLLETAGFTVQLIPMTDIINTDFTPYDLIMVADDTGDLNLWGTPEQVAQIRYSGKPILGLGEGGYAILGQLNSPLGWPHGWHGPESAVKRAPQAGTTQYYTVPHLMGSDPLTLYLQAVNAVGIYQGRAPAFLPLGLEIPTPDHAVLSADGCYQLWGFSPGPLEMTGNGKQLMINAVVYGLSKPCTPTPVPIQECLSVAKSATPPDGTPVTPGEIIQYTLTYHMADSQICSTTRALLIDSIPADTLYVPGSASDGISPTPEKTLIWELTNLTPGTTETKTFSVQVLDTQCLHQGVVINQARIKSSLGLFLSNEIYHPLECPPIVPGHNNQPPYAEDEIKIYPYPLVAGTPAEFSVRVRNISGLTQTVTVTFQTSPQRFGIGLNFGTLPVPGNPRVITLTPFSQVEVKINWTPPTSGHYCIQVRIEGEGFIPVFTQRNLDVAENLQPGIEDILPFKVGNPTPVTTDVILAVDNSCPGWTAWVTPTLLTAVGPHSTDIRDAELHVIPPVSGTLGTACHIDVQGWAGGKLIGGIRKLDVPPVHLPPGNPWWEEKEITINPAPPIVGQPAQYCVWLQNPLPLSRTVTVIYNVADFGAGIPFTPIATRTYTLPPISYAPYCITWTPTVTGTLHRCLLIILRQAGFQDQRSQHNINLVRRQGIPINVPITFQIGNTARYTRLLTLNTQLFGLPPNWQVKFTPTPPPQLGPGAIQTFTLQLQRIGKTAEDDYRIGDTARVEVEVLLDGEPAGGLSVEFISPHMLYLPIVVKNSAMQN